MTIKYILKFFISAAFLIAVFHKIDLVQMVPAFKSLRIDLYMASLIMMIVTSFILAAKFYLLMPPSGIRQPIPQLFRINLMCRFYSFFLTPAVGQSLVRWYAATKGQAQGARFITVMVVERATFLFVLCGAVLLLLGGDASRSMTAIGGLVQAGALVGLVLMATVCAYFFHAPFQGGFNRILMIGGKLFPRSLKSYLPSQADIFRIYLTHENVLIKSIVVSLVWHLFFLLRVYLLSQALQIPFGFFQISWMASSVLFLQMLPITLNGIGLRESAYAALFSLSGGSAEQGVLFGLAFFSQMVILSAIGGILVITDKK